MFCDISMPASRLCRLADDLSLGRSICISSTSRIIVSGTIDTVNTPRDKTDYKQDSTGRQLAARGGHRHHGAAGRPRSHLY